MDMGLASCIFVSLALTGCDPPAKPDMLAIPSPASTIACVNPDTGFAWFVRLDAGSRTVDGWPAHFAGRRISWRDGADGGLYQLDRASGALTIVRASSTGGYTSFDHCENSRGPSFRRLEGR